VGVRGESEHVAIRGRTEGGVGVRGSSAQTSLDLGDSNHGVGIHGIGNDHAIGVLGVTRDGVGVLGRASGSTGFAGVFQGDVEVTGKLVATLRASRINHPLDARRYLIHAAVECPEMKTVYDGIVVLDGAGEGIVRLPIWFETLNRDVRYQLTPIGSPATGLHIAREIENNEFVVGGGAPGMKVCWQVTGVRQDEWAKSNPIHDEEDKEADEYIKQFHSDRSGYIDQLNNWLAEDESETKELMAAQDRSISEMPESIGPLPDR
jgi:hypothetical protein